MKFLEDLEDGVAIRHLEIAGSCFCVQRLPSYVMRDARTRGSGMGEGTDLDNSVLDDSSIAMGTIGGAEGRDLEINFLR